MKTVRVEFVAVRPGRRVWGFWRRPAQVAVTVTDAAQKREAYIFAPGDSLELEFEEEEPSG